MTNLTTLSFHVVTLLADLKERYGGSPHLNLDPVHHIERRHNTSIVWLDLCPDCSVGVEELVIQMEELDVTEEKILKALLLLCDGDETRH
jgi:hypothetical protein